MMASRPFIVIKRALLERSSPLRITVFREKLSASVPFQIASLR
jgi:hypothetical protein